MNIRNEIKAHIVQEGTTMSEVVRTLAVVHGWSASVPNLSDKLKRGTLRYSAALCVTVRHSALQCGNRISGCAGLRHCLAKAREGTQVKAIQTE